MPPRSQRYTVLTSAAQMPACRHFRGGRVFTRNRPPIKARQKPVARTDGLMYGNLSRKFSEAYRLQLEFPSGVHRDNEKSRTAEGWPERMGHAAQAYRMRRRTLGHVDDRRRAVRRWREETFGSWRGYGRPRRPLHVVGIDRRGYTAAKSTAGGSAVSSATRQRSRHGSV